MSKESLKEREPIAVVGGSVAVAAAAIVALLAVFGVDIDEGTVVAVLGAVSILAPIVVAWISRSKVYSPATVDQMAAEAAAIDDEFADTDIDDDEFEELDWDEEDALDLEDALEEADPNA